MGLLDEAERLFQEAAQNDPSDAVAVMGLARVAVERGDDLEAYRLASRASTLDEANDPAAAMTLRLHEILTARGERLELPARLRRRQEARR